MRENRGIVLSRESERTHVEFKMSDSDSDDLFTFVGKDKIREKCMENAENKR